MQIVRPTFPKLESFANELAACLATGQVTNNGRHVVEFERQLTAYLGVPTIVFSSGQAALLAMLRAADVDGGEVIVPSFTFSATPHAVAWSGGTPVFAEIVDDMSFGLDPLDVERRIGAQTRAILAVDPYGIAPDYAGLGEVARRHGIKLLSDSAAAFGTRVGGQLVGGNCDAQIFSFHATKAFATMEGGCLCTHDPVLMDRAKTIRNFGLVGTDCPLPGFNGKMMEISALIGIQQLKTFDAVAKVRRTSADRIAQGLTAFNGLRIGRAPVGQQPVWLYLPVMIDEAIIGKSRDTFCELLARENLHVRKYYSPACHQMTIYSATAASLPISEAAAASVIALPIYNDMTTVECDGIVEAFSRALR